MDSIFAKLILFFASILSIASGPNYIKPGADNLTFDFRTGEIYPIYYFLNVQNAGPGTERFEISSGSDWVFSYREGTGYNFVELPSQAYINFVLEIHPERLADGVNEVKVNLRVLDIDSLVSQELVLDKAEVSIILNKNIDSIPTISIPPSETILAPIVSSIPSLLVSPSAETNLLPVLKQLQSLIDSIRILL